MSDTIPRTAPRTKSGKIRVPIRLGPSGRTIGHAVLDPRRLPDRCNYWIAPAGFIPTGGRFDLTVLEIRDEADVRQWILAHEPLTED